MRFVNKVTKLFDAKTILSLTAAYVFAALALKGFLDKENVMVILVMVFQSFFSYQTNKANKAKDEE